ncbi:MAG: hypothetical protein KME19_13735 [Microcoleus vaginatus WJT46-NPBG5]|jgi:hypothetical protein|nr:hypothetical protein [Microcoleus vaginatus WJT46-NPBG5]
MNLLELERETAKMVLTLRTRNSQLGKDLINYLRTELTLEEIAGLTIISVERLLFWYDTDSVFWAIENIIPADVMLEVQRITSVAAYKRLIGKGLTPGKDFSVDAQGKLLMNVEARTAILTR